MELSRQEYWNGLPFTPMGDLPEPGIKLASLASPKLAGRFLPLCHLGSPKRNWLHAQLRQIWGNKIQKGQKKQLPLLKSWEHNQVLGAKARYCASTLHQIPPKRWANHLSHPSGLKSGPTLTLTPYKELAHPILEERALESATYFHSPTAETESQLSLAWTSYLTCYQFLFTKDSQELWSITLPWFNFYSD